MPGVRTNSGERLLKQWKIPAVQARYHRGGKFFMPLERFPGALCDPDGYVVFRSREEYTSSDRLRVSNTREGDRLNVTGGGISRLPGYRAADPKR